MATVVDVLARLRADSSGMVSGMKQAENATNSLTTRGIALGSMLGNLGAMTVAMGLQTLKSGAMDVVHAMEAWQLVQAKTNAVLASTGGMAGATAAGMTQLAESLSSMSGVQREVVLNAENVLATFTNIRNVTGKNNDIFNQTTKAALNLSAAFGGDLQGATRAVGMAMNSPIQGLMRLQRLGVQFTDAQKTMVKEMVNGGNLMGAQKK